ncbi:ABC-type Fe3+-siderophore transport system, permease component [Chthonomonas calidirosea]|uniref:ABC-type Fe3+-siderophore transport system,permease component n=1 Tax=Chthonomonas calidirosea (strain DSM 23976 / ICMP 18418 / T49) TaxID=1303518 RepID=S0EVG9_CHTCT|nr:iron ABC transporter permease [Chthonomonas calidirosea]CCW35778.1 ABC-type Fe3+-siderophore transport system,permease component [Chthonomonas calidirosea T49]CEK19269.1 ABC-type Fe3+-siderophore transport system, permease component [Chthonomonas calidirosea]
MAEVSETREHLREGKPFIGDRHLRRTLLFLLVITLLLFGALLLDIWMGPSDVARVVTPSVVAQTLLRHMPFLHPLAPKVATVPYADVIVWQERVPRALAGALVGMLLAAVGVAFQSLLMNPLADPYTVGIASGSALGSLLIVILGGTAWLGGYAQMVAAFASGVLAVGFVLFIARVGGRISPQTLLLAGVIVGTFCWSLIPLIVTLGMQAGADREARIMATLFGSLESVDWQKLGLLLPFGLLGTLLLWRLAPQLDLLTFGEETAAHLGVHTERLKRTIIVAGALVTAAAVATAGIIAFIGFVTPHAARQVVGPRHRHLLPAAMLLGALLLVLSDWMARVYLFDIQVGVVTSLFGVPLFFVLLRKQLREPF